MNRVIKVGKWTISPTINRIENSSGSQNVGPRLMHLLLELLDQSGEVKSREYLLSTVWHDVVVNEESLTKSISFLRSHFGDKNEKYIETIRSVGYRWIGPIPTYIDDNNVSRTAKKAPQYRLKQFSLVSLGSLLVISIVFLFSSINQRKSVEHAIVNITNDEAMERVPRLSPDGTKVLYAATNENGHGLDIFIRNIKTDEITRLTTSRSLETDPVWSADGSKIAYYKNNSEDVYIQQLDLLTGRSDKIVDVHAIPNLSAMSWSPDGRFIVYCDKTSPEDRWSLYKINVQSLNVKRLTSPLDQYYGDVSPRYSPDGKKLAFIRVREEGLLYKQLIPGFGDVFVMNLEDGVAEKVFDGKMEISGVEWLKNDDNLAVIQVDNFYTFKVTSVNLTSKLEEHIYDTEKLLRNLSGSQNRGNLVLEEWSEKYSIWKADIGEGSLLTNYRPLVDIADKSWHPQASRSGKSLAYITTKSGHNQLWVYDLDNKKEKQLTDIKTGVIRNPRWSPDDSRILFETYEAQNFDIHAISVETGSISPIASTKRQERNAVWSVDGNSIYYALKSEGIFNICKKKLSDNSEKMITSTGAFAVRISSHGVFYLSSKGGSIYHINQKGESRSIICDASPTEWFNWEIVNDHVYYVKRESNFRPHLYSYNLIDQSKTDMSQNHLNFSNVYQGFSIDPLAKVVYATVKDFAKSDIKMLTIL